MTAPGPTPGDRELAARLRAALGALAAADDPPLLRRAGRLSTRCLVTVGDEALLLDIDRGRLALQERCPPLTSWDFAVRGTGRAWHELWQAIPAPGWHDLFALSKRRELRLEGNLHPFMAHLEFFKRMLAAPRPGAIP